MRPHLGRLHATLVVVEHDVVRLVADLEAVDVALAQVEVLAEHGQERREVVVAPRRHPDRVRERRRARHLRTQVGRNLARLVPVARRDTDEARLERVVLVTGAEVAQVLEETADISRDELRVSDPADGCELLRANGRAAARHHHLLVPAEQRRGLPQVLRSPRGAAAGRRTPPGSLERNIYQRPDGFAAAGGPGGGSEDDPPPGRPGHGDDGGRGLYPPSAETRLRHR